MKRQTVFFIADNNMGNLVKLSPRIPEKRLPKEDSTTPRICVCTTTMGCIKSLHLDGKLLKETTVFLYEAAVDNAYISVPTKEQVPDVENTGELWITKPTEFELQGRCDIQTTKDFNNLYHWYFDKKAIAKMESFPTNLKPSSTNKVKTSKTPKKKRRKSSVEV